MNRLRWKGIAVLAVIVAASIFVWYPPLADWLGVTSPRVLLQKRLILGLDLRGGVEFVLRVNTEEALAAGGDLTRDEIVDHARQAVDRRVNALGVVEPWIAVQGADRDEILVQLPGFTDVARAQSVLGTTARLEWKLVDAGPMPDRDALLIDGRVPEGTDIVATAAASSTDAARQVAYYRLRAEVEVSGRDIRHARAVQDDVGLPAVAFTLTPEGGRRFADLTARHVGRQLAIVLDDRVESAPVIQQAIAGGEGVIQGTFTPQAASDLALLLRSGTLPVSLTYLGGHYVGPTLGAQSISAGVFASLAGFALVAIFMLVYYRRAGVNAVWSVIANLIVLLGAMASIGAALTLPGIAGLILTIGMGVDSNVLIYERIREELQAGRPVRQAVRLGFRRVFLTILDTHVASLIAAAVLFQFGTGPIRGFATTLTLGLLANVFTAVVVSRTLFEISLSRSRDAATAAGAPVEVPVLTGLRPRPTPLRHFDFMAVRKYALAASAILVAAGLTGLAVRGGVPLGLDFTGGSSVVATFAAPVSADAVREAIAGEEIVQRYGPDPDRTLLIRVPSPVGIADAGGGVTDITTSLAGAGLPSFEISGSQTVGPSIGDELRRNGIAAAIASLAGISAYIAARFRPSFAAGAVLATAHDLVVTITALALAGFDLTPATLAALLTIAGYSVNDTIVIFDRVREAVRGAGGVLMASVINLAVNHTLPRTIITAGTTLLSVLALYLFGGDALRGFAFALLVGVAAGTYSTIFVAAPVAARLARGR
jgi:SecD/SecF fusion protein